MGNIEKSKDRLEVLEKIKLYEKEGWFDKDVENDPPGKILEPKDVDYLNKKFSSKIKTAFANLGGKRLYEGWMKNKVVIFDGVLGLENLKNFKGGAIVTCNHINAFDNYAVYLALNKFFNSKSFRLYKVIKEDNYFVPGSIGFFMKNANTLPLSSNTKTMINFMKAISTLLEKDKLILVYPEQSMWWNYKKPRPYKTGAFKLAAKNNVPIIPCFITIKDSDIVGNDGFYVQKFVVNIMPLIYPNKALTYKENTEIMMNKNFEECENCYENFYNTKLTYTCDCKSC